jgi:hypothetical protein
MTAKPARRQARGPIAIDIANYLGATASTISHDVLQQLYGAPGVTAPQVYAGYIESLGMPTASAIQGLLSILPGTEITGEMRNPVKVDEHAPVISMAAKQALFAASDASYHSRIDRMVKVRPEQDSADDLNVGLLTCTLHPWVSAHGYLDPQPGGDWRYGVSSNASDIVCVIAARTPKVGLLLGSDVIFHGRRLDDTSDEFPQGWVLYGPRKTLAPGRYRLEMDISLGSGDDLTFDIVSQRGLQKIVSLDLSGTTKLNLGFDVGRNDNEIEVRLCNLGGAPFRGSIHALIIHKV